MMTLANGTADFCKPAVKPEVFPTAIGCVCLLFSLVSCFLGHRCSRMVLFLSGCMFGSEATLVFFCREPVLWEQLGPQTQACFGLGMALLCGLSSLLISPLGLLLSGLQLGTLLATFVLVVLGRFWSLNPDWALLGVVMATSVVTAVVALLWQKLFVVIYTSVLGATAAVLCVEYLVGALSLPGQVSDVYGLIAQQRLCWFHWAVAGCIPGLALIGAVVQWTLTAGETGHAEVLKKRRMKKAKNVESRRRRQQHQRPAPLQRYTGDVLAPSYLRILQEHQSGTGSSCSSSSTRALMDFDTRSTAPLACSPRFTA
ncbi:transmembrane protein 198-like [Synchiropus splendidus]|uniref:transmembrane protein 198-like n=1 Tax=Synchiropus splendidus TaxID=270530 RepID=UPI00237DE369|nr:transmembrane protein 198-like [Synchiropus splendidus]XP_053704968.1 transmembrane protein 198-like [Synchiropus splendidus]